MALAWGTTLWAECSNVACVVCVIALVTQSIRQVCLAINAVGLLRSSTNNKINVCVAGASFFLFVFVLGLWFSVSDVGWV